MPIQTTRSWRNYIPAGSTCLGFIIVCIAIQMTSGMEWASLEIEATRQGQLWRLVTGHLTHLDRDHFLMNMAGLSLCIIVFHDDVKPLHWIASFLFISIFSSIGMCYVYAEFDRYVGFSDVLHGWILLGAASIAHKEPKLAAAIFILFWLKILEENLKLPFFTSYGITGNVAKESHIYGSIGGMVYSLMFMPDFRKALSGPFIKNKPDL